MVHFLITEQQVQRDYTKVLYPCHFSLKECTIRKINDNIITLTSSNWSHRFNTSHPVTKTHDVKFYFFYK